MQPLKYDLYPSTQSSIARSDAFQYITNVTLPLSATTRQDVENYLTSFNRRKKTLSIVSMLMFVIFVEYGVAKIVYAETITANQTRFYLVVQRKGVLFLEFS